MRILHTIAGLGKHSGGTSTCTYELVRALNQHGCTTDILTALPAEGRDAMVGNDPFIHAVDAHYRTPFCYSAEIRHAIKDGCRHYDLIHTDGLWLDVNYYSGRAAHTAGIPYVVSPHGMLYPQALNIKPIRKKLMRLLCFDRVLRDAACIHVTCEEELEHYRALGFRNPVAVIPNLLPIPEAAAQWRGERKIRRIGFLGRFHPIKNIPGLLEAWRRLGNETRDAELLLVGSGAPDYEAELRKMAAALPEKNVRFCGFVAGEEKFRLLGTLSALCLPSLQENFGMTVLEAWLMRTPAIATKTTPWRELETHHCGWWVDNTPEALAAAVHEALTLPESELTLMGENGYRLLHAKYSAEKVATQMIRLYRWLLGEAERPEFVQG